MAAGSSLSNPIFTGADMNCIKGFASGRFKRCRTDFLTRLGDPSKVSFPSICSPRAGPGKMVTKSSVRATRLVLCCGDCFKSSVGPYQVAICRLSRGLARGCCASVSPLGCCGPGGLLTQGTCATISRSLDSSVEGSSSFCPGIHLASRRVAGLNGHVCHLGESRPRCFGASRTFVGGMFGNVCTGGSCNGKAVLCISRVGLGIMVQYRRGSDLKGGLGGGGNTSSLCCAAHAFTAAGRMVRTGGFIGSRGLGRVTGGASYACLGSPTNVFARTALPVGGVCRRLDRSAVGTIGLAFGDCGRPSGKGFDVGTPACILLLHRGRQRDFFRRGGLASGVASCLTIRGTVVSGGPAAGRCIFAGLAHLVGTYIGRGRRTGGGTKSD